MLRLALCFFVEGLAGQGLSGRPVFDTIHAYTVLWKPIAALCSTMYEAVLSPLPQCINWQNSIYHAGI